jgi:hypothetical protein
MPQLPPVVWLAIAGFIALLFAICVLAAMMTLRLARRRGAHWPARRLLTLLAAAAIPWLAVWLAPIHIVAKVNGTLQLIAWLLAALLVFALLVLLPLAALIVSVVWWRSRRNRGANVTPTA